MNTIEIIAQGISIIAMAMNVLSYQKKTKNGVVLFQLIGGFLFSVSFLLLGSYMGALLNLCGFARAIVYLCPKRLRADSILWLYGFTALYLLSYAATFLVLDTEPTVKNLIVEFLPVIGMTAGHVGIYLGKARTIRYLGYVASPSWLIYNIFTFSIGAIICEVINLVSITVGILRFDIKKKEE